MWRHVDCQMFTVQYADVYQTGRRRISEDRNLHSWHLSHTKGSWLILILRWDQSSEPKLVYFYRRMGPVAHSLGQLVKDHGCIYRCIAYTRMYVSRQNVIWWRKKRKLYWTIREYTQEFSGDTKTNMKGSVMISEYRTWEFGDTN
jgi:hypothetical protein